MPVNIVKIGVVFFIATLSFQIVNFIYLYQWSSKIVVVQHLCSMYQYHAANK